MGAQPANKALELAGSEAQPVSRRAWFVVGLLFWIGLLNYFDRQTLSILKATLKDVLGFDDADYSLLITAFMVPYIVMYVLGGRLVDRFGTRVAMTVLVVGWSLANTLTGLVSSFGQLAGARALLGFAEAGTFPALQRVFVTWVPAHRRAFAMSLVAPSTTIGAVLAPPLVALMTGNLSWRGAFILPGLVGIAVAVAWWFADRNAPYIAAATEQAPMPFRMLLREKRLWALILARGICDPVWYFHLFWIPGYLQERLGLSLSELGWVGWIPTFVGSISIIVAGRVTDARIAAGRDPVAVRTTPFILGAVLAPVGAFITLAPDTATALMLITVVTVGCQMWFFGTGPLVADLFPASVNATAFGLIGAFGASTALLMNFVAGPIIERFGYGVVFASLAVLHPLAAFVLRRALRSGPGASGLAAAQADASLAARAQ